MRRQVLLAAALAIAVSGCWLQPRFDAGRTNANPHETRLTAATVAGLTELWSTEVGPGVHTPIAVGDRVYVTASQQAGPRADARAAALDAASGEAVWTNADVALGAQMNLGDPAWHDGQIVVPGWFSLRSSIQGGLYRLDAATGASVDGVTENLVSYGSVAVAADTLAFTRGEVSGTCTVAERLHWVYRPTVVFQACGGPAPGGGYAIVGDRVLWSLGTQAWGFSPACPPYPGAPAGFDGCGPDWTTELGGRPTGPARLGDDAAVYADDTGTVSVLDVATGAALRTHEVGGPVPRDRAPAVGAGHVYVTPDDGRLVALAAGGCGAATCPAAWQASLGAAASRPPVAAGDVVYVATVDARLLAFAAAGCGAATCEPLAAVATGSAVTGGPIVHDGRVYVGLGNGTLTAFGLR